jgi:hypothetical protein
MRLVKMWIAVCAIASLYAGTAFAADDSPVLLLQPNSVKQTVAYQYRTVAADAAEQPAVKAKEEAAVDAGQFEEMASDEGDENKDEPKRLIGKVGKSNVNIYGWIDMGITGNADRPNSHYNGPLAPNDRDDFQFNQNYLVVEKALDTENKCWDLGGRVDFLYGSDWIYFAAPGAELHSDGSPDWNGTNEYGLGVPQAYAEIGHNNLSFKLGRFYTIIGYESMMATSNFFYSMNYAVRYAEPTTHTGGLFTLKANDALSLYLGGVNGGDRVDGLVDSFAVLGGFAYAPKEKKWALNFGAMSGGLEPTLDSTVFAPRTYFSTYLTYNFTDKFQSVTQWDAGWQQNYNLQDDTADFWSVTQYLFYTLNPCWKAGLRYDLFTDDQATRLGGLRFGGTPGGNPLPLPSGNAGTVQAITAGLNYTPNNNLRIRPELRWDWYQGQGQPLFNDRSANRQFTAAVDMIVQF